MTHVLTFRAIANTDSDLSFISVTETTQTVSASTSDVQSDGYNETAVRRILKANRGPFTRAPDDSDEFLNWLEA